MLLCGMILFSRGAKLCVVKSKRKEKQAEALTQDYIITREYPNNHTNTHTHTNNPMQRHMCTVCFVYMHVCINRIVEGVCVENNAALESPFAAVTSPLVCVCASAFHRIAVSRGPQPASHDAISVCHSVRHAPGMRAPVRSARATHKP